MSQIQTSALLGLGALGILFGEPMQRHAAPGAFRVIADAARIERYRSAPITANGRVCHFDFVTPEEGTPVDFLLVAVKATALDAAIGELARFVGPNTVIVSVLNGVTSEERLARAYPGHVLWSVAINMDATRTGRTLVYSCPGKIQLGERSGEMTPRVQAAADYLTACGIENEPCTDILTRQWVKLMINDGLNQASAAFDVPYGGFQCDGEPRRKMLEAMDEVIRLANLEGVPLSADLGEKWCAAALPTFAPEAMPSMRQDVLAKRPTEVEEFSGVVRRLAQKHGLPVPANDFFYARLHAIEAAYQKP